MSYKRLKELFERYMVLDGLREHIEGHMCSLTMPAGAGTAWGVTLGHVLAQKAEILCRPDMPELLAAAEQEELSAVQRRTLQLMHDEVRLHASVPQDLIMRWAEATAASHSAWRAAKPSNNWQAFMPTLQKTLDLTREVARYRGAAMGCSPYQAMVWTYQPGLAIDEIDRLLLPLGGVLPGMIDKALARQGTRVPHLSMEMGDQQALAEKLLEVIGFNRNHGRVGQAEHPFSAGIAADMLVALAYRPKDFMFAATSAMHEGGHALYQQGLGAEGMFSLLGWHLGMAAHEATSLLYEMQVARGGPFSQFLAAEVQKLGYCYAPGLLTKLNQQVSRGFIRIEADELTYSMHILIRYELEKALFAGELQVADLPAAWNELSQKYLGLDPGDEHAKGCMQDTHWSEGLFGYFPSYTVGAMLAAQLMVAIRKDLPDLDAQIAAGNLTHLKHWMGRKVWSQGQLMPLNQLIQHVTGKPLGNGDYLAHLQRRYL